MTGEYDFPTVRTGALCLTACFLAIIFRTLFINPTDQLVEMLKVVAGALAGTHFVLVAGQSFISSKWSAPVANTTQTMEKTTMTKTTPEVKSELAS